MSLYDMIKKNNRHTHKRMRACTPKGCVFGDGPQDLTYKLLDEAYPALNHVKKHPSIAHKISSFTGGIAYKSYLQSIGKEMMQAYKVKDIESFLAMPQVPTQVRDYVGFCYAKDYM